MTVTNRQRLDLGAVIADSDMIIYVLQADLPAAPLLGSKLSVQFDGAAAAQDVVLRYADRADKAGGLSNWRLFAKAVR